MLLDTTAQLVDEVGIEGVTTGLLAERADVSIGSVYRFFPDRLSLMRALSERNFERFVERFTVAFDREQVDHWRGALEIVVREFVHMHETEAGFRTLRFGDIIDEQLLDGEESNNGVLAGPFADLAISRFGVVETEDLRRQIQVATEICDGLLTRAFLLDPKGDRWLIEECKTVIAEYLEDRLVLA